MDIVESKVCGKCGRKLRPGTSRCPACNINFYRRTPRLVLGILLIIMFAVFCGVLYLFTHLQTRG